MWHVDDEGVLHAPRSDDVEEQQRHAGLYNTADVHVLLFSAKSATQSVWASGVPAHEGIAELAYVLAGIGGVSTEGRWPVWQGEGKGDGKGAKDGKGGLHSAPWDSGASAASRRVAG